MLIKISPTFALVLTIVNVVACASITGDKCNVDEQKVLQCIKTLEAENHQQESEEFSVLKNLEQQFNAYKSSGDCDKFVTVYNAHFREYCGS